MERRPRRVFTWVITTFAVLVILAASASGLFQLAVQSVPGYRDRVERDVRELTGRPVRIDALALTWRYYYPSIELIGVALLAEDGRTELLRAERLRLGFALTRLVTGDMMPNRLELHGLAVDALIDADGKVTVKGIDAEGAGDPIEALRPLTRFDTLRLERCRLNVRDGRKRAAVVYSFGIAHAELDRGLILDAVEAEIALPGQIGDLAVFDGNFTGELLEPKTWSGSGELRLTGLAPGNWVAPYLARGAQVQADGIEARLRGRLENGRVAEVRADLRAGATRVRRARQDAGFESLEARVRLEMLADGWKAQLERLALDTERGRWPETKGELRAIITEGEPTAWQGDLSHARLADLAPWLRVLPVPDALATLDGASGTVRDAQFRVQGGDEMRYSYRARFEELALPAGTRAAGFAGARGELAGDERGGRAVLQENPLKVELPGVLLTPEIPVELFEAEVEWRKREAGWTFGLPQFRWELWTTRGNGRVSVLLPEKGGSPELDLEAQFMAEDATRAKPLMPQHWGSGLHTWLDRSIVRGRAPRASLVIKGPLRDFPFVDTPSGQWQLDIEAQDVELAYQPDWPPVEDVAATLRFSGNGLDIQATRGVISGNPIKAATARFPDFATGQLLVDGTVTGEIARYYEFLSASPLRETFATLLSQTSASGPASVEIHLDIPVSDAARTNVRGRVGLQGVELRQNGLPAPIQDIRGDIDFDLERIESKKLTAKLYELAIDAALVPQGPAQTLLKGGFRLAPDAQGRGASDLIPAWIRQRVGGASDWRAELPLGKGTDSTVKLTTDLVGVEVRMPPPLGKAPDATVPLTVLIGSKPGTPLHVAVDYQERFGADLHFAKSRGTLALERGALRAGGGPPIAATEKGLVLGGQVAELDARAWSEALSGGGADVEQQVAAVRRADLHVGRATWDRWSVRDARYQWTAQKGGWSLSMIGAGAIGEAQWSSEGRGQLNARLDQLALAYAPPAEGEAEGEVLDPGALPLFDLDVRRLALNDVQVGHVAFATARTEAGQRLRTLKVDGAGTTLSAEGEWRRRAGQSSAKLNADLGTGDIGGLLRAFHYTQNIDAKVAAFRAALSWAPSEKGLQWQQAQGTVHLEFENGQLRAVEPGAGRVLGLINFYALPRRLTLNFRDVLSSGLGFDKVNGDFELRDGSARTQNLDIVGPSLRMEMRGRIGLAARDYDQTVSVYPDVSAGVTLGALALGGPIAGALAFIAQEVLDKPLNQVTQLTYRVTGGWDNPQVERASAPAPPPPPVSP